MLVIGFYIDLPFQAVNGTMVEEPFLLWVFSVMKSPKYMTNAPGKKTNKQTNKPLILKTGRRKE